MGRITSIDQLDYAEDVIGTGFPVIIFVGPPTTGTGTASSSGAGGAGGAGDDGSGSRPTVLFGYGMPNIYVQYNLQEDGTYSIPEHFKIKNYTVVSPYVEPENGGVVVFHLTSEQLGIPLTSTVSEKNITSDVILKKILEEMSIGFVFKKNTDLLGGPQILYDDILAARIEKYYKPYILFPSNPWGVYIHSNGMKEWSYYITEMGKDPELITESGFFTEITAEYYETPLSGSLTTVSIYSYETSSVNTLPVSKIYYKRSEKSTGIGLVGYERFEQYNYTRIDTDIKITLPSDLGKVPAFSLPSMFNQTTGAFAEIYYGTIEGKIPVVESVYDEEEDRDVWGDIGWFMKPVSASDEIVSKLNVPPEEASLIYYKDAAYNDIFNFEYQNVGKIYYLRQFNTGNYYYTYRVLQGIESRVTWDNDAYFRISTDEVNLQFNGVLSSAQDTVWPINNELFPTTWDSQAISIRLDIVEGGAVVEGDPEYAELSQYLTGANYEQIMYFYVNYVHVKKDIPSLVIPLASNLIFYNDKICSTNKIPVYPIYPKFSRGITNIRWNKVAIMVAHFDDELILFQPLCELVSHIKVCMYPFNDNYNQVKAQVSYGSKVSSIWPEVTADKYSQPNINGFFDSSNLAARDDYFFNNDRLRNQIKTTILELKSQGIDTIITHSPWGDYGHTHHMWIFSYIYELAIENKLNVWCQPKYYTELYPGDNRWWSSLIYSNAVCVTPNYEFDETLTYNNAKVFHSIPIEGSTFDKWTWVDLNWDYTDPVANKREILSNTVFPSGIDPEIYLDYPIATIEESGGDDLYNDYLIELDKISASPCLMMICGTFDNTYQNVLDPANENYILFKEHFIDLTKSMTFSGGVLFPSVVKNLLDTGDFVESPFTKYNSTNISIDIDYDSIPTVITAEYTDFNTDNEITKDFPCTYEWTIEGVTVIDEETVIKNQANLQFTTNDSETTFTVVRIAKHPVFGLYSKTLTGYIN